MLQEQGGMTVGNRPVAGDRRLRWVWAAALLAWLLVAWPLASGDRTLFLRDVFATHCC